MYIGQTIQKKKKTKEKKDLGSVAKGRGRGPLLIFLGVKFPATRGNLDQSLIAVFFLACPLKSGLGARL